MGRPKKTWTDKDKETFEGLCRIQCTQTEVCEVMGINRRLLARLIEENYPDTPTFGEAFERFSANGRVSLRRRMFAMAEQGDKTMLIYLSKNYLGMSDTGPEKKEQAPKESKLLKFRDVSKVANA